MKSYMNLIFNKVNYNPVTLSCNSSLNATLSKFRPQYTQEPEVKNVQLQSFDKRRKGPEKILRTPVTATRTGDEFYVENNGEANQSKYPIELRARLTRQNYIHACIIRYVTKYYTIGVCTIYVQSLVQHSQTTDHHL